MNATIRCVSESRSLSECSDVMSLLEVAYQLCSTNKQINGDTNRLERNPKPLNPESRIGELDCCSKSLQFELPVAIVGKTYSKPQSENQMR